MKSIILPLLISIVLVVLIFVLFKNLEGDFNRLLADAKLNSIRYSLLSFLILSSDILLPVPSSIVMYMNGLILGIIQGFLLSLISSLISTLIGYGIGRVTNFSRKEHSLKARQLIEKYGNIAIILTRGIPILAESICFTAGYNRMNIKHFLGLSLIGYFPVCMVYSVFGSLGQDENIFLISFGLSLLVSALIWFFGRSLFIQANEKTHK